MGHTLLRYALVEYCSFASASRYAHSSLGLRARPLRVPCFALWVGGWVRVVCGGDEGIRAASLSSGVRPPRAACMRPCERTQLTARLVSRPHISISPQGVVGGMVGFRTWGSLPPLMVAVSSQFKPFDTNAPVRLGLSVTLENA